MNGRKGLTLVEIIVAIAILAASLMLIVSIIPTGVLSLKKAEDYQSASTYGVSLIEEVRNNMPAYSNYPVTDLYFEKDFNNTTFSFQRDLYAVDLQDPHKLFDVIVTVNWQRQQQPLQFSTRVYFRD